MKKGGRGGGKGCVVFALITRVSPFPPPFSQTGSAVAYGKLSGKLASAPLSLPGKNAINVALAATCAATGAAAFRAGDPAAAATALAGAAAAGGVLGWHTVASIGGGDMPVCITLLNAYSG